MYLEYERHQKLKLSQWTTFYITNILQESVINEVILLRLQLLHSHHNSYVGMGESRGKEFHLTLVVIEYSIIITIIEKLQTELSNAWFVSFLLTYDYFIRLPLQEIYEKSLFIIPAHLLMNEMYLMIVAE